MIDFNGLFSISRNEGINGCGSFSKTDFMVLEIILGAVDGEVVKYRQVD